MNTIILKRVVLASSLLILSNNLTAQTNFVKYNNGIAPVLEKSSNINDWDFTVAADAEVVFYQDTFRLWYTSAGIPPKYPFPRIGYAWSLDGANWTKHGTPVFEGTSGEWDSLAVETVTIVVDTNAPATERYKMWYVGTDDPNQTLYHNMGYAYSNNGINWTKSSANPVLSAETTSTGIDILGFEGPSVVFDGNLYHMWYTCIPLYNNSQYWDGWINIAYASSIDGINWTKKKDEPVFKVSENGWDSLFVQTPDVILIDHTFHMFYTGTATDSTYQTAHGGWNYKVGYAWAPDNDIHNWTRYPNPVLEKGSSGNWDDASVGLVTVEYLNHDLHIWYTGQDTCINDSNCVWPDIPYWDIGYAIDTSTILSNTGIVFKKNWNLQVYPNPTQTQFTIQVDENQKNLVANIFNSLGQKIVTLSTTRNSLSVNTSEWKKGVYFIQVQDFKGSSIGTKKIIIW